MTDDNVLAAYDFSAWDAPPPPAGLADAVVRRMTAPHRPPRRAWVVAATAVAVAAAVLIALLVFDRSEPAVEPDVASQRAKERENQREIDRLIAELAVLETQIQRLQREHATAMEAATPSTIPQAPYKPPPPPTPQQLDRKAIDAAMAGLKPALLACGDGSFAGTVKLTINLRAGGAVERVRVDRKVAFTRCLERVVRAKSFGTQTALAFSYPLAFAKAAPPPKGCDASELEVRATEAFSRGMYPPALAGFERALACKWSQPVVAKAMLAACHAKNEGKARQFWPKLSPNQQPMLLQRCLERGLDPR